jgi:peptidoglycan/LPS O-acetylase OafA/YrhL
VEPVPDSTQNLRYKGYIPGLDVLRGLAILLVVVYHATDGRLPWYRATSWVRYPLLAGQYGSTGVQLFFVLSGFLISGILIDTAASKDYYRKFYIRRALRILPAYLLLLIVLRLDHVVNWRFVLASVLYIANMAGLVGARGAAYGALWSLAVEEQFYIIWPVIVRKLSLQALTRLILGYCMLILLLRVLCLIYFPHADLRYKLWFNADALLSGALVAICLRRNLLRRDNITRLIWSLAGAAILFWPLTIYLDLERPSSVWLHVLRAVFSYGQLATYCVFLLLVIRSNQGDMAKPMSPLARSLAFFGYISYGLYLVHQLVFLTVDRLVRGSVLEIGYDRLWSLLLNSILCLSLSTGIAYLSRRYFEQRFLRQKDKVVPYKQPAVNEEPVTEST